MPARPAPVAQVDMANLAELLQEQNALLRVLTLLTLGAQVKVAPSLLGSVDNDLRTLQQHYGT